MHHSLNNRDGVTRQVIVWKGIPGCECVDSEVQLSEQEHNGMEKKLRAVF